jgi:octaprenyl-diphosphate synthase
MNSLDTIISPIKEELKSFNQFFSKEFHSNIALINIISKYLLRQKGKQIRPVLTLLVSKLNGTINESSYVAATLIELLHTATLVHDDVVDESFVRRGMFSINAIWRSKGAVLFGDYLLTKGLLVSLNYKQIKMLEVVSNAVKAMIEGELLQLQSSRKLVINRENYFSIIRYKTASLFKACSTCGAISTTLEDSKIEIMKQFGENLGIAFQIKDDLLDINSLSKTGKPLNNDLKDKKFTLPIILSLKNAPRFDSRQIIKLIRSKKHNFNDIKDINNFIIQYNGIKESEEIMKLYANNARECLISYTDNEIKIALNSLIEYTIDRTK